MNHVLLDGARRQLPAKAQGTDGLFAFLFNIIDLITSVLGLFDLLTELFSPDTTA